jgi:hypothetical protein
VSEGTRQEPAPFAVVAAQTAKVPAKHEKNLSVGTRCWIALRKQVQHSRPQVVHGPIEHLMMQKPYSKRQKQRRKLRVRTCVKRELLLDQGGRVFVAASKMHHVEQNRSELQSQCSVVDGIQLRSEEFECWAAASSTLQVFKKAQCLGINIATADSVLQTLTGFIDLQTS